MNRSGYDEETYFTFSYSPIRSEGGAVEGMFCACQETTEKVIGERRLKTLRELAAQTTTANSPEGAVVMAMETLSGNPADMPFALLYLVEEGSRCAVLAGTAGVDSDRDSGSPPVELDEQDTHGWPLGQVLDTGSSQFLESLPDYFTSTASGPWKKPANRAILLPIQFAAHEKPSGVLIAGVSPVRPVDESYRTFFEVAAGQISSAIANARAYQKERQRAEALAELDRAKTLFFSNVSHEFRTPLSLMLGPIEDLLSQEDTLSPSDHEQIGLVHRNGLRLLKLVNTLMDFSRIEAGRMEAVYEPTDLPALTADLASVFRSAVEKAGMDLLVDCPPLMEPVYVDREMWEKIVSNLLSNAFKFTLEGKIEVGLRQENGNAVLSVRDTGAGIAKEEIQHIFERFHRVKETRARTLEGTGIGLALVYELVKLHGGKISAESEEGEGSTFTVSIPTGRAHLPDERIEAARSLVSTALGAVHYVEEARRWLPDAAQTFNSSEFASDSSIPAVSLSRDTLLKRSNGPARSRILVADDNADMRDYLRRILSGQYEVLTASNGKEALSLAIERLPDLILSDIMMPEIDGFGLLRSVRANEKTKLIPVILLSAHAGEEAKVVGLEAGADDYLIKPFSARELMARVGAQIAMARLQRESRQALSESEERFRALYEHSTDAIVLTDPRHGGKVLTANPAACTLFGWSEAELMGKT
ncbi:MAG: ATP-binding protein, partial [Syntrophobacteraceae bacterium]